MTKKGKQTGPTIGIAMISRDGADLIMDALGPLLPHVDEVRVGLDTRTTDETRKVAEEVGATVFDVDWTKKESFADARNVSLEAVKSDWVLIVDDDEVWKGTETLRQTVAHAEVAGADHVYVKVGYFDAHGNETFSLQQVRLFRNGVGWKYAGRIHAYPTSPAKKPSITAEGLLIGRNPKRKAKKDTGLRLRVLTQLYEEGDRTARTLFYYAREHWERRNWLKAIEIYLEYLTKPSWHEERFVALIELGRAFVELRKLPESMRWFAEALQLRPGRKTSLVGMGQTLYYMKEYHAAIPLLERALAMPDYTTPMFVDRRYERVLPYELLSPMYGRVGRTAEALAVTLAGLKLAPESQVLRFNLEYYTKKVTPEKDVAEEWLKELEAEAASLKAGGEAK